MRAKATLLVRQDEYFLHKPAAVIGARTKKKNPLAAISHSRGQETVEQTAVAGVSCLDCAQLLGFNDQQPDFPNI
jgi:hypothetical protein